MKKDYCQSGNRRRIQDGFGVQNNQIATEDFLANDLLTGWLLDIFCLTVQNPLAMKSAVLTRMNGVYPRYENTD